MENSQLDEWLGLLHIQAGRQGGEQQLRQAIKQQAENLSLQSTMELEDNEGFFLWFRCWVNPQGCHSRARILIKAQRTSLFSTAESFLFYKLLGSEDIRSKDIVPFSCIMLCFFAVFIVL